MYIFVNCHRLAVLSHSQKGKLFRIRYYSIFTSLIILIFALESASVAEQDLCPVHEYLSSIENKTSVCTPCTLCPPGKGATSPCGQDGGDTKCEPCQKRKTFSSLYSDSMPCVPCSRCRHAKAIKKCRRISDTRCGRCKSGYFKDSLMRECRKCSYCYPQYIGLTTRILECSDQSWNFQCRPLMYPPLQSPATETKAKRKTGNQKKRNRKRRIKNRRMKRLNLKPTE